MSDDWLDDADTQPAAWGVGAVLVERRGTDVYVTTSGLDTDGVSDAHTVALSRHDSLGLAWLLARAALVGR